MSPAERVKLVDAAMRSHDASAYLDGVRGAFEEADRGRDSLTAVALRMLLQFGEIETVMRMRAEWQGGGNTALRNPDIAL